MKKKFDYIVEEHFKSIGTDEFEKRKTVLEDIIVSIIKKEEMKRVL
jgi:hypothetical protein